MIAHVNTLRTKLYQTSGNISNTYRAEFVLENTKNVVALVISSLIEANGLFILPGQYHGCWWPGDRRSRVISSRSIDLVIQAYSNHSTSRVNWLSEPLSEPMLEYC